MNPISIAVKALWDDEAKVWVATSNDIQGLAVEAETIELLQSAVNSAICDLIECNGFESEMPEIPVHFMAESMSRLRNPCH